MDNINIKKPSSSVQHIPGPKPSHGTVQHIPGPMPSHGTVTVKPSSEKMGHQQSKPINPTKPSSGVPAPKGHGMIKDESNVSMAPKEPCKYCAPSANQNPQSSLESCKYCAAPAAQTPISECKYCAAMDQAGTSCKYCNDSESRNVQPQAGLPQEQQIDPTAEISQDYASQDLDQPVIPKPVPGEEPPIEQAPPMNETTLNNTVLDVEQGKISPNNVGPNESLQLDHSKEAMMNIAQQFELSEVPGVGQPEMEENVSRPDGFKESNIPGDMGLAEEPLEPDLTSVLNEGLDYHADNIQREKVVQMVSQALAGFKASKQIIERAQSQAPNLYLACVQMLRAMIEMSKLLGLDKEGISEQNPLVNEQNNNEWHEPFPVHPENNSQPQVGQQQAGLPQANPSNTEAAMTDSNSWSNPFPVHSENGGQADKSVIGQGIGKLPTAAMTPHVSKTPIAPGSVNAQGQMRYVDPKTQKESFINMMVPRKLNDKGRPVK